MMRKDKCPPAYLNKVNPKQSEQEKYFKVHLDKRLTWKKHIGKTTKVISAYWHAIPYPINNKSFLINLF